MPLPDLDSLCQPLTGSNPDGARLPGFSVKDLDQKKLKSYREEVDAEKEVERLQKEAANIDDPRERSVYVARGMEDIKGKKAEWNVIVDSGSKYLKVSGKDLQVATAMVEAMTVTNGMDGLAWGIQLLRRLTTEFWPTLHPAIDNPDSVDDVEERVNLYGWLDQESLPFFPETVRKISLLKSRKGKDISVANRRPERTDADGKPIADPERVDDLDFHDTISGLTSEQAARLNTINGQIDAVTADLMGLISDIDNQLSDAVKKKNLSAPSFSNLRSALDDIQFLLKSMLSNQPETIDERESPGGDESTVMGGSGSGGGAGSARGGPARTRDDVYRQLTDLALELEKFDPHSPVPFVIQRAVELRDLKFPQLVKKLTETLPIVDFISTPIVTDNPDGANPN